MIKLSNYLDYLSNEIIQARKQADLNAVKIAQEYAKHEYLKFFRVPRFAMPSIKMEIPIKISELDSETKYDFKMNENQFIEKLNQSIKKINEDKKTAIPPVTKEDLNKPQFKQTIDSLERRDHNFVRKIDDSVNRVNYKKTLGAFKRTGRIRAATNAKAVDEDLEEAVKAAFKSQFNPVSAKLNHIFIDPNTNKATDKDKIMVKLNVEMVEEGLRIVNMKDENGKEFQEIIFE